MKKIIGLFSLALMLSISVSSFGQSDDEYATITVYRIMESAMSGGRSMNVKIFFNDKEVTAMQTNMKLVYKLSSTGSVKVKMVGEMMGGPIGSPYVETFEFEKGKQYNINITTGSMFGVKGNVPSEKELKKINKNEFADTIEMTEGK